MPLFGTFGGLYYNCRVWCFHHQGVFIRSTAVIRAPANCPQLFKDVWMRGWYKGGRKILGKEPLVVARRTADEGERWHRRNNVSESGRWQKGRSRRPEKYNTRCPISLLHPQPSPPCLTACAANSHVVKPKAKCEALGLVNEVCRGYSSKRG